MALIPGRNKTQRQNEPKNRYSVDSKRRPIQSLGRGGSEAGRWEAQAPEKRGETVGVQEG